MIPLEPRERLLVALDTPDLEAAVGLARRLGGTIGGVKVGIELYGAHGPEAVRRLASLGVPVFLDLKFHDIPNTVAGAIHATVPLAPFMINVHAAGGPAMMQAAAEAAARAAIKAGLLRPRVVAVTVLTSLGPHDLHLVGVQGPLAVRVVELARLARDAGLDGVVCSAREAMALRGALGRDFILVVPGIRPTWSEAGDQKRIVTPAEAAARIVAEIEAA